ncbi:hypothetical protein MLD38_027849 [Melastoma candidum]|uniref:Uncharacterized protein n=1 Tax=Melastoma candidum TaxID=119954 RepID=A0ACB9P3Z2_9MYRT|nr:hypothetical protein MLD38_027849 [Melastoma candidum]
MVVNQLSCQLPEILLSSHDSKLPEGVNSTEELHMANEEVIILGWKHDDQLPVNTATQTDDIPVRGGTLNLLDLVTRTVDGFGGLDEELKLIRCQAMKFILESVGILTDEFASLLDTLTARVRDEAHKKFFSLLDEHILGLRLEIQMMESAQTSLVRGDDLRSRRRELHRLLGEWGVAANEKKKSLLEEMEEWDKAMDRMTQNAAEMSAGKSGTCIRGNLAEPVIPVYVAPVSPVVPRPVHVVEPEHAVESDAPETARQGVDSSPRCSCMEVSPGPHVQPLTMQSTFALLYEAITDPKNRPQALDELVIKEAMEQLRRIQDETNRAARCLKCKVFRDFSNGLQGVPEYVGDLHEELVRLGEEDARETREDATQEARAENVDPPPFFIFRPLKGCSFDSSEEDEEWREAWRDDRHTSLEPPSSDDHGSSSS